jgi:antitoxin (DNA-binding transcriptional repressor) of toxin-antitoxin stability system
MHLSLAFLGCCGLLTFGQSPSDEAVRATIERSLPFIQAEGQRWIDEKKCVTCHQVPFMVWSLNAAAERGIILDEQQRADCAAWAIDWKNMATKEDLEKGEELTLARHNDPVAQLLLAQLASGRAMNEKWPVMFAERLAAGQQEDGSWKAGGQLPSQKRPERETQEVTTMWSLVALQSYGPLDESRRERFAKAREWLSGQTEAESTEWWAVRLILERGSGNVAEADRSREAILKSQQNDGGWGWLVADESDAFGTGVALYALAHDGLAADHPAVAGGRRFLVSAQQKVGSWPVKGTKKAKAKQIEPTATYWGTCWAVIGLAETLPMTK